MVLQVGRKKKNTSRKNFNVYFPIGGVLGVLLGRYAGKKVTRKIKRKKAFKEIELHLLKLSVLLKWYEIQHKKCKYNLNSHRLVIEKVIFFIYL